MSGEGLDVLAEAVARAVYVHKMREAAAEYRLALPFGSESIVHRSTQPAEPEDTTSGHRP